MKTLKFKCRLVSDVILNQSAATEGSNSTLDFIPGNVFLGIVARHYNDFSNRAAAEVFHSGRVRFGDAHPVCVNAEKKALRTLHVPASLFYPKLKSAQEICYVHHAYDRDKDKENDGQPQQLKQCRQGFYAFDEKKGFPAVLHRTFSLKSAYDRKNRRAMDEKMFGYEALDAGAEFLFSVEVDSDELADEICQNLLGRQHIGRSRTAQYGLVDIEKCGFDEVESHSELLTIDKEQYVAVYADSRLIFLDDNGEPTFQPSAKDLGVDGGEIDWEKSQVRTFQYAPWNGQRKTRDQDRCGIEKGSVLVIKGAKAQKFTSKYVGKYQNEGFGRVIYNPDFLKYEPNTNGVAAYKLEKENAKSTFSTPMQPLSGTQLLNFIAQKKKENEAEQFIYKKVNEFVHHNVDKFNGDNFASQWGHIRTIAMEERSYENIMFYLFDQQTEKTTTKENIKKEVDKPYLTHGVAKDKWKKYGRRDKLEDFLENINDEGKEKGFGDIVAKALINLAAEMAKKAQKGKDDNGKD